MRLLGRILAGLAALLVVAALGLYSAFWWKPIGINNYVNKFMIEFAIESPELLTNLGLIDNTPFDFHSGKLGSYTKEQEDKSLERLRARRAGLDKYGPEGLSGQELLTWEIAVWFMDDILRQAEFEYSGYRVNQISGPFVNLPQFLTDTHVIKNEKSVRRYISRLNEFGRVIEEVKARIEDDRANGVTPPDFIIEKTLGGMRSFIEGGAAENPLATTMPDKLAKIEGLSDKAAEAYMAEIEGVIENTIIPGYESVIALFEDMAETANHDAGIWRLPNGDAIYAAALKSNTTTDMTPDEVHNIGLEEVARIESEMDAILQSEGRIDGSVSERVKALMSDPEQIFPNTDEGRQAMLDYLNELNDALLARAGDFFNTLPPQPLEIVRVPEYSQDSAPGGYYQQPALDGSRPGRFYINQKNTADNPKWTLPTLMYHEGAPGHHFQIALQMNLKGVPQLRKFPLFTAYAEGWALYAERMASLDMGVYQDDALGDLGRLQAEMFRAVRLVVDTGMHAKRWSREDAIDYMVAKTGMTEAEVTREIERYVVWPGQATSYKSGQLAIIAMREKAEAALGDDFDLRGFHDVLLNNGAMPLGVLDAQVDAWIAAQ